MRADSHAMLLRQLDGGVHDAGIGRVKAAGDVSEVDMRHQRGVVAHVIEAETLAHIAVDGHAHREILSASPPRPVTAPAPA
jgi:hypothetical protein